MRILLFVCSVWGLYLAGTWACLFWLFRNGGSAWEPNKAIATAEMSLAVLMSGVFLGCLVYSIGIVKQKKGVTKKR